MWSTRGSLFDPLNHRRSSLQFQVVATNVVRIDLTCFCAQISENVREELPLLKYIIRNALRARHLVAHLPKQLMENYDFSSKAIYVVLQIV